MFAAVPGPVGFDLDRPSLAGSSVPETRPRPILGLGGQSPGDGIAVDVAQLLHKLSMREDIEVIVARLPKAVPRVRCTDDADGAADSVGGGEERDG